MCRKCAALWADDKPSRVCWASPIKCAFGLFNHSPKRLTQDVTQRFLSNLLDLKLSDPGWLSQRQLDDSIPDHNHFMHLYLIRWPEMDVVYHLHPEPVGTGQFELALPSIPAGDYHLYADVVHASGFPETLVATMLMPPISGTPLAGDDAGSAVKPVTMTNATESTASGEPHEQKFPLPDGYTMVWKMPNELVAKAPEQFRFELLDPRGKPPADMALYMGMLGHAAFIKDDGTVFVHLHPTGTVAMAAFMMANPEALMSGPESSSTMSMASMPGMDMKSQALPNAVSFPYGFPSAGPYRIIVQMKHGNAVETGVFDAKVQAPPSDR